MDMVKSIGAVLAGFMTVIVLTVITDGVLEKVGLFPPSDHGLFDPTLLTVALIYRSIYAVVGGYVTAYYAHKNPMKHVAVLGILGTIGGVIGIFVGWELSQHWYPIALAITAFPLVWWGGYLYTHKF